MTKKKKGQSSAEAAMLITIMIVVLLSFFVVLAQKSVDNERDLFEAELTDLADFVKTEVQLAYLSEGNYQRNFSIPAIIRGRNYSINFYSAAALEAGGARGANISALVITAPAPFEFVKTVNLPKAVVYGDICKGYNVVNKSKEGEIMIECSS